jgi:hypothetical protein
MKVFDLRCSNAHTTEGWFASEDDFLEQNERGLILCPVCGDSAFQKLLSAPRLNFGAVTSQSVQQTSDAGSASSIETVQTNTLLDIVKRIVSGTTDVGTRFAEEARKIHYGEAPERAIRGQATLPEAHSLLEEGIAVMPIYLPETFKGTLH